MHYSDDPATWTDANPPAMEWRPTYWVGQKSTRSLGDSIADFMEKHMTPTREAGGIKGDFKLFQHQRWLLNQIFELDEEGFFRWREVYLQIPRKNSKTFLLAGINLWGVITGKKGDQLILAASSSRQAGFVYDEIRRNAEASPLLMKILHVTKDRITNRRTGAYISRTVTTGGAAHGTGPWIATGDEMHTWDSVTGKSTKGEALYASLTTGSMDRRESISIWITTAGERFDGIAHGLYEKTKSIATGVLESDVFCGFIWEAEEFDDISNPEVWLKANPCLVEGLMSLEAFAKIFENALTTDTADFERYHLNRWLRSSAKTQFILPLYWKQQENPTLGRIPEGASIAVGFDGSTTEDSTGIVGIDLETGLFEVLAGWEQDRTNESWFVDAEEVQAAMEGIFAKYTVRKLYADPSKHREQVHKWMRQWGRGVVRDIPPTAVRMTPIAQDFRQALYAGKIWHAGGKALTAHALNAVDTRGGLPSKEFPNSSRKIDFLMCAILAYGGLQELQKTKTQRRASF